MDDPAGESSQGMRYTASISFEPIKLPPFRDLLIVGRRCHYGPEGLYRCYNYLAPDEFRVCRLEHPEVDAVLVANRLLKRMPCDHLLDLIEQKVLPFVNSEELVRVDLDVTWHIEGIEGAIAGRSPRRGLSADDPA
ncbi:MAG: hypothetical protein ACOCYP_08115 [Planctomycetota bacterium]